MKWFKHQSNSNNKLKQQKFKKVFGMEGYGFYWLTRELVAEQGVEFIVSKNDDWREWLEIKSNFPPERIDAMLEKMAEFDLIDKKEYEKGNLSMPDMQGDADEYTQRKRVSRYSPDSVVLEENRVEEKRRANIIIAYFMNEYKSIKETDYIPSWGKDYMILFRFLSAKDMPDYKDLVDWFLKSPKCKEHPSISACFSADSINHYKLKHKD